MQEHSSLRSIDANFFRFDDVKNSYHLIGTCLIRHMNMDPTKTIHIPVVILHCTQRIQVYSFSLRF